MPDRRLAWIVGGALALRGLFLLFVLLEPERALQPDSLGYLEPARQLRAGAGFTSVVDGVTVPMVVRTPGYPTFLAILGANVRVAAVVQVAIDVIVLLLIHRLARPRIGGTAALVAAGLYAGSTVAAAHAPLVLTETLFTGILMAVVVVVVRSPTPAAWFGAGLLTGLAALVRPVGLALVPIVCLAVAAQSLTPGPRRWHRAASAAAVALLGVAVLVVPWVLRNGAVADAPTLSTISATNLLYYNAASVYGQEAGLSQDQARAELIESTRDEVRRRHGATPTPGQQMRVEQELALEILASNPGLAVRDHLRGDFNNLLPAISDPLEVLGLTLGGRGTLSVLNRDGPLAAVQHYLGGRTWLLLPFIPLVLILAATYVLAVGGLAGLRRLEDAGLAVLLLGLPTILLLIPGAASNPRFRVPAMPWICLLASMGALRLTEARRHGR